MRTQRRFRPSEPSRSQYDIAQRYAETAGNLPPVVKLVAVEFTVGKASLWIELST